MQGIAATDRWHHAYVCVYISRWLLCVEKVQEQEFIMLVGGKKPEGPSEWELGKNKHKTSFNSWLHLIFL